MSSNDSWLLDSCWMVKEMSRSIESVTREKRYLRLFIFLVTAARRASGPK